MQAVQYIQNGQLIFDIFEYLDSKLAYLLNK